MLDFMKFVMFFVSILSLMLGANTGCDAISAGPKMIQTTSEGVTGIGRTLISKINPDHIFADASAEVTNPEFVVDGFMGSGVKYEFTMRLIGADMGMGAKAQGPGGDTQADTLAALQEVWKRPGLDQRERESKIFDLLGTAFNSQKTTSEAATEPATVDTGQESETTATE